MKSCAINKVLCLAILLPSLVALAEEDNAPVRGGAAATKSIGVRITISRHEVSPAARAFNEIKVAVVVDMTDAGKKFPQPTPAHPTYFYPVTRGYTVGQGLIEGEKPPPPTAAVQHLIALALAKQGYLVATSQSPPSLILTFWWGYKAPVMNGAPLPTDVMTHETELEELVFGSSHDRNTYEYNPSLRLQALAGAASVPRYYVTVSALDFAAATREKKIVVLWTAHVSTGLYGHTLEEVLPTLIATGAPQFGKDTGGAVWPFKSVQMVPMGHVEVGAPYLGTSQ